MSDALQEAREKVEARARAKRDKFYLANEVLGYDFQPDAHAELFANFIQYDPAKPWGEQSEVKDRMVLWSRGHYKTTAIVVEIIQAIINFPNIRILLMQGSIPVTKTLLKQVMAHFTGDAYGSRFKELFNDYCGEKKELLASAMQFTSTARTQKQLAQATVTVASPRSIKTGQHYDAFFGDDLVNESNYRNFKLIAKVKEDFTNVRPLMDPGSYFFVSGTRWAFGDLYEEILRWHAESGKWLISIKDCWTDDSAKLPDPQKKPRFPKFVKKNGERGGFTTAELLQLQADDPANFACQYLNKPIHTSQQAYTKELLEASVIKSEDTPALSQPLIVVDLATSDADHADDSVIQVGKIDNMGVAFVTDMRGGQWVPMELAMNIIDMTLRHRPVKVFIEKSAAGDVFSSFLRLVARQKNVFIPIEFIKVSTKPDAKNMRVVSLAGVIKRGKFKFLAGLPQFEKLIEQAITFPKGKYGHDDYIDTAALLYGELSKEMLTLPMRPKATNPILAMIADRENGLIKVLTDQEREEANTPDQTGLE